MTLWASSPSCVNSTLARYATLLAALSDAVIEQIGRPAHAVSPLLPYRYQPGSWFNSLHVRRHYGGPESAAEHTWKTALSNKPKGLQLRCCHAAQNERHCPKRHRDSVL